MKTIIITTVAVLVLMIGGQSAMAFQALLTSWALF